MNGISRLVICAILTGSLLLSTGCRNYKLMNEQLVERLNSQLRASDYERIYNESAEGAKTYKYSKDEFIARTKTLAEALRAVDESLTFEKYKGKTPYADPAIYRDDNYAYRYIENGGKKIGINFWLTVEGGALKLLDLCIYPESPDASPTLCVSDASKS